jgi:hypothetical protein
VKEPCFFSYMRAFVSKSFDLADREVNSYFERLMRAAGVDIATAEEYTDEPIPVRVERVLSECDFLIGIYVIRYEDTERRTVVTSQWLMRETFTAHGQGKKFIALVEEGVTDTAGLNIDKELIYFRRDDRVSMQEATIKFIQALHWHALVRGTQDG